MGQVQVLTLTNELPPASPISRLMIDEKLLKAEQAQAKQLGVDCKYVLDDSKTGGKTFDQLTKAQQKLAVTAQAKRVAKKPADAEAE